MYGLEYAYFSAYSVCIRRRNKKNFLDLVKNKMYSSCLVSLVKMFNDAGVQELDESRPVFEVRNTKVIFSNPALFGCAEQLSRRRRMDLDFAYNPLCHLHSQLKNIVEVIRTFLFG